MTRVCSKCGIEKEITSFARNGKYYKYRCKQCDCNAILEKIKLTQLYVFSLKTCCEECGYDKNKYALEFHHINENEKDDSISHLANTRMWSKKTKDLIDNEVKKCKCLCANCHREKHHPEPLNLDVDFSFKEIDRSLIAKQTCRRSAEKFNAKDIKDIRFKYNNGLSINKLSKMYHCHTKTISKIVKKITYINI